MKKILHVVVPQGASSSDEQSLVELTRQLRLKTGESGGFGLGGQDGYGINYENDVFMMHPYCWCEQDDCKWCSKDEPNFIFKPTKCGIRWYKYIGRDQVQEGKLPADWLKQCINSIWSKDDCWYEIDISPHDLREGLFGREDQSKIILNFNVSDKEAEVSIGISSMAEGAVEFWTLDDMLSDSFNLGGGSTEELNKIIELNRKYPALQKKIGQDAIKNCKERMKWIKQRINKLTKELNC
jgi:hypothetical protein